MKYVYFVNMLNQHTARKTIEADGRIYKRKSRELEPNKENKLRKKLFNFIKNNKDMVITFYHGTSEYAWEQIQRRGYFTSPKMRNAADKEVRKRGLDEVFFTTKIQYANFYAERGRSQHDSKPIILELKIPLYYFQDVSAVILNTQETKYIYNEYGKPVQIKNVIDFHHKTIPQIAEDIKKVFTEDKFENDEYTIKHLVPIKFVTDTSQNKSFMIKWIKQNEKKYHEFIAKFPYDPEIIQAGISSYISKISVPLPIEATLVHAIQAFPKEQKVIDAAYAGYLRIIESGPSESVQNALKYFPNDEKIISVGREAAKTYPARYLRNSLAVLTDYLHNVVEGIDPDDETPKYRQIIELCQKLYEIGDYYKKIRSDVQKNLQDSEDIIKDIDVNEEKYIEKYVVNTEEFIDFTNHLKQFFDTIFSDMELARSILYGDYDFIFSDTIDQIQKVFPQDSKIQNIRLKTNLKMLEAKIFIFYATAKINYPNEEKIDQIAMREAKKLITRCAATYIPYALRTFDDEPEKIQEIMQFGIQPSLSFIEKNPTRLESNSELMKIYADNNIIREAHKKSVLKCLEMSFRLYYNAFKYRYGHDDEMVKKAIEIACNKIEKNVRSYTEIVNAIGTTNAEIEAARKQGYIHGLTVHPQDTTLQNEAMQIFSNDPDIARVVNRTQNKQAFSWYQRIKLNRE